MKLKVLMTFCVASLALSACGGAATQTAANKAGNAVNTVANTVSPNSNANSTVASANKEPEAEGDVLKIDEAGIMMIVPKGFKYSKDGEDTVVKTEDEGVDIRFTVPQDGDYNAVVSDAAEEIDAYLNEIKIEDKGSKTTVNGMEATEMSGSAKDEDGETVLWSLTVINAPKKPVLANIYAEKTSLEKNAAAVKSFLESVKKQ